MEYKGINFEHCGDPLTPKIIDAFCYGARLPRDYEDFLCKINGGIPDKNVFDCKCKWTTSGIIENFLGISLWNCEGYEHRYRGRVIPSRMIVIAIYNSRGKVVMSLKNPDRGKVYILDPDFEPDIIHPEFDIVDQENLGNDIFFPVGNSFDEFLSMLYPESENDISAYEKGGTKAE